MAPNLKLITLPVVVGVDRHHHLRLGNCCTAGPFRQRYHPYRRKKMYSRLWPQGLKIYVSFYRIFWDIPVAVRVITQFGRLFIAVKNEGTSPFGVRREKPEYSS